MVAPFTFTSVFTRWVWSPVGVGLAVAFSVGYAVGFLAALRRGERPSVLRAVTFYLMGVGSLLLATDGGLAADRDVSFMAAAAQSAVLAAIAPLGIALGDPVGLMRPGSGLGWLNRVPSARVWRVLMFPAAASVLAVGVYLALFVTSWLAASLAN